MAFRANSVIPLLLVLTSFVNSINSVCIVDKHPEAKEFRYHCVRSSDYVADANRGPIDVKLVIFSTSNIPKIQNAVFTRFSQNLTILEIVNSKVKEIEDDAFQGLTELSHLNLAGNELEIVKEAWFKNLPKLEHISLSHNKIRQIEDGFFSTVSSLKQFAIAHNKLTCISESVLSSFTVKAIFYEFNPWSWRCLSDIVDWIKAKDIKFDRYSYDGWFLAQNVTKNCIAQSPNSQPDDNFINDCVQAATAQWLPSMENYTARHVCALPNKSSFLWCGN